MKAKKERLSYRKLANELGVSASHICRVVRGERVSRRLTAALRKRGVGVRGSVVSGQ